LLTVNANSASSISDLATQRGTSRKFVYQQMHKASITLDDAFLSATPDVTDRANA
jgi:hypothetical protein